MGLGLLTCLICKIAYFFNLSRNHPHFLNSSYLLVWWCQIEKKKSYFPTSKWNGQMGCDKKIQSVLKVIVPHLQFGHFYYRQMGPRQLGMLWVLNDTFGSFHVISHVNIIQRAKWSELDWSFLKDNNRF